LKNSIKKNIAASQQGRIKSDKRNVIRWSISAAAAIIIFIGVGLYYFPEERISNSIVNQTAKSEIVPGGNKAVLTLANGKKISLTDADNGMLAEQAGIRITKTADGQLIYTVSALSPSGEMPKAEGGFNTIETPRGGQYQIILPDGTKVWLNAASSLKYPASFASLKERRVELKGEAYFEVVKAAGLSPSGGGRGRIPFIVNTDKQEVEVLGTHFNVNAYTDEAAVKTALLEGSVKVYVPGTPSPLERAGVRLKPGQQSALTTNGIKVENIDTELAVAWKNNQFIFESDDIQYIMRMIARWYNVEVEYVGAIPKNKFGGAVSRFENVSEVLKSLESTGRVKFKIEGRRILVSK